MPNASTQAAPRLTPEQAEIAGLPAAARTIVIASAGTGKTHVLAARLADLLLIQELRAADVLVLSFSRAAVAEIGKRVAAEGVLRGVFPTTFDSYATNLLATENPHGRWQEERYEGRIVAATKLLQESDAARRTVTGFAHILVDEVQDLVGTRAQLVRGLLEVAVGGFTLFGDPAQSIYGFRASEEQDETGPDRIHAWVRRRFADDLVERLLKHNFRAQSPVTKSVLPFGERLKTPTPDYSTIRRDLDTFVLGLPPISDLGHAAPLLKRASEATTAILCRTNGQALEISKKLFDLGIRHQVQRRASDHAAPAWMAEAASECESPRIGKGRVMERLESIATRHSLTADEMWRQLKLLDRRRTDDLDWRLIADKIRDGLIPEQVTAGPRASVLVSSIHRAKGLEFYRVFVAEPNVGGDSGDDDEETHVIYVALTRAIGELFVLRAPDTSGMRTMSWADGRWLREAYRGRARPIISFEVRGADVDAAQPAGAFGLKGIDVRETQAYIGSRVCPGDLVELVRYQDGGNQDQAFFAISHGGRPVGVTSPMFCDLFGRVLRRAGSKWPTRICNLHVEFVDAVVGQGTVGAAHGLGASGIWRRVRVFGLGDIEY